jgi:hypothetical protein
MSITGPHNNTFIIPKLSLGDTFKEWFDVTNTRIIEKLNLLKVYTATGIAGITANTDTSGELVIGIDTIIPGDHIFTGNITFNGQTTTINSTEVTIDDYILELGHTGSSGETGGFDDATIDSVFGGGGIRVLGADRDKEWIWRLAQEGWETDENIVFGPSGDNIFASKQNILRIHETHLSGFSSGIEIKFVGASGSSTDNLLVSYNTGPSGGVIENSAINQHAIEIGAGGFVDIKNGANRKRVNQVGHGFPFGAVVRKEFNSSNYVLAQADSKTNAEVVGIVSRVVNADYFDITFFGEVVAPAAGAWADSLVSGQGATLSAGDAYFLSPTQPGKLTINPPQAPGQIRKPLLVGLSDTSGLVTNYIGHEIPNEVTAGAGGASNRVLINQVNNFFIGDVVAFDSDQVYGLSGDTDTPFTGLTYENGTYVRAQANSKQYSNAIGIVDEVNVANDPNKFYITTNGRFTLPLDELTSSRPVNTGGAIGFNPGKVYYLDADVSTYGSAQLTENAPTTVGYFTKPVLVSIGANDGYFLNHLGIQNGTFGASGSSGGSIQPLIGRTFYPIDRTLVVQNRTVVPLTEVNGAQHGLICFDEVEDYIPAPFWARKCDNEDIFIVVDLKTRTDTTQSNVEFIGTSGSPAGRYLLSAPAPGQVPVSSTTYSWTSAGCPIVNPPTRKVAIACDLDGIDDPRFAGLLTTPSSIVYDPDSVVYGETFFYIFGSFILPCADGSGRVGTNQIVWRRVYVPMEDDATTLDSITSNVTRVDDATVTNPCDSQYNVIVDEGCVVNVIINPRPGGSVDDGLTQVPGTPTGPGIEPIGGGGVVTDGLTTVPTDPPTNPGVQPVDGTFDDTTNDGTVLRGQFGTFGSDFGMGWFGINQRVTDQNALNALNSLPFLPIGDYENNSLMNFYDRRFLNIPASATHMLMTFIFDLEVALTQDHFVHIKDYIQGDFYLVDWKVSEQYVYGRLGSPAKQQVEIQVVVPFNINQPRIMYAIDNVSINDIGPLKVSVYVDGFYISESGSGPGGSVSNNTNILCNGDFDFWERGVTGSTSTSNELIVTDRWMRSYNEGTLSSPGLNRGAFDIASASTPRPYSQYYLEMDGNLTGVTGADSYLRIEQRIEDVRTLAGGEATVSFHANGDGGDVPVYIALERYYGASGDNGLGDNREHIFVKNVQISGNQWKRYTATFNVPDFRVGSVADEGSYVSIQFYKHCAEGKNGSSILVQSNANALLLSKVQLESGSIASSFSKLDKGTELQRCQRYYWNDPTLSVPANNVGYMGVLYFPTTMYRVPTVTPTDGNVTTSGVSTRSCVLSNGNVFTGLRTGFSANAEI